MSRRRLSHLIDERLNQILRGWYSPMEGLSHTFVSDLTNDSFGFVDQIHELIHRDLSMASELGYFETLLGAVVGHVGAPVQESDRARKILKTTISNSWMVHESAAVYCSIVLGLAASGIEIAGYLDTLPKTYRAAYYKYSDVIGVPDRNTSKVKTRIFHRIALSISIAALNVPLFDTFKSYSSVTPECVAEFIREHNPDARQDKILEVVKARRMSNRLLEIGELFFNERIGKHDPNVWVNNEHLTERLIVIESQLGETIMDILQAEIPDMFLTVPLEQRRQRWEMAYNRWRSCWILSGYKGANDLAFSFKDSTQDAMVAYDEVTKALWVEIPGFQDVPFFQARFVPLSSESVKQYLDAVYSSGQILLICILFNPSRFDWEIVRALNLSARSVGFFCRPILIVPKLNHTYRANTKDSLGGPVFISCPIESAQDIANKFDSSKTIWLRWRENQNVMISRNESLITTDGLCFVCSVASSVETIIQTCRQLTNKGKLILFLVTFADARKTGAEFVIAVQSAPSDWLTFYVFPATEIIAAMAVKALQNIKGITCLNMVEQIDKIVRAVPLAGVLAMLYGPSDLVEAKLALKAIVPTLR